MTLAEKIYKENRVIFFLRNEIKYSQNYPSENINIFKKNNKIDFFCGIN